MSDLYFEDIEEDQRRELGSYTVPKGEMTEFARRYDPQPIHADEFLGEAASMAHLV